MKLKTGYTESEMEQIKKQLEDDREHRTTRDIKPTELQMKWNKKIMKGKIKITKEYILTELDDNSRPETIHIYELNKTHRVYCYPTFELIECLDTYGKTDKMTRLAIKQFIQKETTR